MPWPNESWAWTQAPGTLWNLFGLADPLSRMIGQTGNFLWPNVPPDPMATYQAFKAGYVDAATCKEIWNVAGRRWPSDVDLNAAVQRTQFGYADAWAGVAKSTVAIPGMGDLLTLLNRRQIDDVRFAALAKHLGYWDTTTRNNLVWLSRNLMPSPPELVTFALRDAWNPEVVARYQYDAEFPAEFAYWMARSGFQGDATVPAADGGAGVATTWPQLYWRVHWQPISPTQSYEMYQRLRPDRLARFGPDFAGMRAFTIDDIRQLLRINDYPVPFRDQLTAIAFRRPRLVDVDRFFRIGLIDRAEVLALHRDLGYNPADAEMRTEWLVRRAQQLNQPSAAKQLPTTIARLYGLGRLIAADARDRIVQTVTMQPAWTYADAPPAASDRIRWQDARNTADVLITSTDLKTETARVNRLLAAWRKRYLRGIMSRAQVQQDMVGAGWSLQWSGQWLDDLDVELAGGRLLLSTAWVKRMVIEGVLPIQTGRTYLTNLGWQSPEIDWIMTELQRDYQLEQERIAERIARDARSRQASQARQAQQLDRERRRVVANLNRNATPAQLRRYYIRGVISESEYSQALGQRGLDLQGVAAAIADAKISRAEWLASRHPSPAAAAAATGAAGS